MKKRLSAFLSVSIIVSSLVMPAATMSVLADDFTEDTEIVELLDEEVLDEDVFEDETLTEDVEFTEDTESFDEETEETESETEIEAESEINEKFEASGTCGTNLTWTLNNGTLTISGSGAMNDYYSLTKKAPWRSYKSSIKTVVIGNSVTSIGNYAFYECSYIEKVTFGNSVQKIGSMAFYKCSKLRQLDFPTSLDRIGESAFAYCSDLSGLDIPDNVTYIDWYAFDSCTSLQEVSLGSGMTWIRHHLFRNCTNLEYVVIPPSITWIQQGAFQGCTRLGISGPDDDDPFYNGIYIPESVEKIDNDAFLGCKNIANMFFYGKNLTIGDKAFDTAADPTIHCYRGSTLVPFAKSHNYNYRYMDVDYDAIEDFVNRLYSTCLGRYPDETGAAYWNDQLIEGKSTGASAAAGFIFSPESLSKNLCNDCFLNQLYNCFMGRNADSNGKKYWLDQMSKGATRADVFAGFVGSNEFKKICDETGISVGTMPANTKTGVLEGNCKKCGAVNKTVFEFIERMYKVCLNRGSDATGREYWLNEIKKGKTGEQVALGFLTSNEIKAKNLSNDAFVETCYKAFFGRSADANGKAYWVNKLKNGETREKVVSGFADSTEFKKLCAEYGIKAR